MKVIKEIAIREIKHLFSNKGMFFILFIWPLLAALLLGGIFSERVITKMPLAVINKDNSSLSRTLERYVNASRSFNVIYHPSSMQEMEEMILSQKVAAGIFIPEDFERNIKTGKGETISLYVDGANIVTANLTLADMKVIVATIAAGAKLKLLRKLGYSKDKSMALISPIRMDVTKNFNPGTNYLNYLPPGTWMALLHQLILLFGALLFVREREKKSLGELIKISNGNKFQIITGKMLPYFAIFFLFFEIFYRLLFPLFAIEFRGNYQLMMFITLIFIFCSLSLGILISSIVDRSIDAIKGVLLVGSPAFLISGYSWPLNYMPSFTKFFASLIPLTHFLDAYRKIYQQAGELQHVWHVAMVLFIYGAISLTLAYFILQKKNYFQERYES